MKRFYIYFVFICLFASCTQNNGRIGPIFGKWQLREIQSAGNTAKYDSIFYSFQSNMVELLRLDTVPHKTIRKWGYFTHIDDELSLDIRDCSISEIKIYKLPDTTVHFKVLQLDNRRMTLRLGNDSTYLFWKTGAIGSE